MRSIYLSVCYINSVLFKLKLCKIDAKHSDFKTVIVASSEYTLNTKYQTNIFVIKNCRIVVLKPIILVVTLY